MMRGRMLRALGWIVLPALATAIACQDVAGAKPTRPLQQDPWRVLRKLPLQEHAEKGWDLLVRDEAGQPAQADVIVYEQAKLARSVMEWAQGFGWHYDVALAACRESRAKRYRTGAQGTIRIASGRKVQFLGLSDGAVSRSVVAGQLAVITMRPHRCVKVEAIDAQGRPASGLGMAAISDLRDQSIATAVTDVMGRCTLFVPRDGNGEQPAISVRAAVLTRTPASLAIDEQYFQGQPRLLRVKLPPVASVRVRMSKPIKTREHPPSVSLMALTESGSIARGGLSQSTSMVAGEVVIPFVALDQRVKVSVVAADHYMQTADGPSKAGEVLTITVNVDPVTVVGQLLDEHGKPFANRQLFGVVAASNVPHAWEVQTDEDGRFAVDVHADLIQPGAARVQLDMTRVGSKMMHGHAPSTANDRVPRAARVVAWPASGRVDLGTLTLQLAPELLTGKVIDLAGNPVAGVEVKAQTGWAVPSEYRAKSGADGRFAFFAEKDGAEPKPSLNLWITAKHWRASNMIAATMGEPVEIQVQPICSVEFRIANDMLATMLRVYMIDEAGRRHANYPRRGICRFARLRPGKYTLQVELAGGVVKRVKDIDVVHGVPNDPTGDSHLAWLEDVNMITIQVQAPDGTALEAKGSIVSAEQRTKSVPTITTGELRLPYLAGQELLVQSDKYRSQQVKPTGEAMKVVMQPRADLIVRTPKGLNLPRETMVRFEGSPDVKPLRVGVPTRLRPDVSGVTFLTLLIPDGRGGMDEVYSEPVKLPDDEQPLEVVLQVTSKVVADAQQRAAAGRAKRAARLRR